MYTVLDWNTYCFIQHKIAFSLLLPAESCSMVITWCQFPPDTCWSPHGQGTWIFWQRRRWGHPSTSTSGGLRCSATWQKWLDRNWTWKLHIKDYHFQKKRTLTRSIFSLCVFFSIGFCWRHSVLVVYAKVWSFAPVYQEDPTAIPSAMVSAGNAWPGAVLKKWAVQRLIFVCDHGSNMRLKRPPKFRILVPWCVQPNILAGVASFNINMNQPRHTIWFNLGVSFRTNRYC